MAGLPVQFSRSVVSDSAAPWTEGHQASLSITDSKSLLKLMSIKLVILPEAGPKTRTWVPAMYLGGDPGLGAWCEHGDKIMNLDKQIKQVLMNEYVSGPFPRGCEAEGFGCIPTSSYLFSPGLAAPQAKQALSAVGFPGGSDGKTSVYSAGDLGLIPGSRRFPEEGNVLLRRKSHGWSSPVPATVHEVAKSQTQLSDFTFLFCCRARKGRA